VMLGLGPAYTKTETYQHSILLQNDTGSPVLGMQVGLPVGVQQVGQSAPSS
jgi:hypothetical protein